MNIIALLEEEARSLGRELNFNHVRDTAEPVEFWDENDEGCFEYVDESEYVGYSDVLPYGLYVIISWDTDKLLSSYYVIHSEDAAETNDKPYESMSDALRYMEYLIESPNN